MSDTRTRPGRSRLRRHGSRAAVAALASLSLLALAGCANGAAEASDTPAISSVSPKTVGLSDPGAVTIKGTGLDGVETVEVGGEKAKIESASEDRVVARIPAAHDYQPGTVSVRVADAPKKGEKKAKARQATAKDALRYEAVTGVDRQLEYALAHWKDYNTAKWGDLNPVGGDCANFVSQTLIARGWKMNDQWYNHDAAADWSPAWGYVPAMDTYFAANAKKLGLTRLSFDQRGKVALGDVVMFDWNDNDSLDHVQIVTKIEKKDGKTLIKMAGHNLDTDYRDLDHTITVEHPGAIGHIWHVES